MFEFNFCSSIFNREGHSSYWRHPWYCISNLQYQWVVLSVATYGEEYEEVKLQLKDLPNAIATLYTPQDPEDEYDEIDPVEQLEYFKNFINKKVESYLKQLAELRCGNEEFAEDFELCNDNCRYDSKVEHLFIKIA
ncbi:MAG: hypothetical protein E6R13_05680 [Spirochaetes bacterium]|nr:MAG: hypothetical protein E6R13_05680 [Spirochaetota bacterium]